jgi:hypothetical protein
MIEDEERIFSVGIGNANQTKYEFKVGDIVTGKCLPVQNPLIQPVEFYKV